MPREVELKSVVRDEERCRRRVEDAGARVVFQGSLADRRYDTKDRRLSAGDQLLRVRTYTGETGERATVEWKGPTRVENGYKVRDEIVANTSDGSALAVHGFVGGKSHVEVLFQVLTALPETQGKEQFDGALATGC